ncbi:aminopeptidase N-like isoform X1 [Styela clava]
MSTKNEFHFKGSQVIIMSVVVVMLLVAEGLLIGLLARPQCENEVITQHTTSKPSSQTTQSTNVIPDDDWRLPKDLIPMSYQVELRPLFDPDEQGRYLFFGSSTVEFKCNKSTSQIKMHSSRLNYTTEQIKLSDSEGNVIDILHMEYDLIKEFVTFEIESECKQGEDYTLTFEKFISEMSLDLTGLYRSYYTTSDGEERMIVISHMWPTNARKVFPCFDEPALKAKFSFTLWSRANSELFAISNMPALSYQTKEFDGELWNATIFAESLPMSTYLIALSICDYSFAESLGTNDVKTRTYARAEAVANMEADYSADIAAKILDYYEAYFSVPYPLPKSDHMGVSDFDAGAMENWGFILYREVYLLYDENLSSVFDKEKVTNIVAHELAHQWFGNLVTLSWWNDAWLNEGFATYVSYLGESEVQPTWKSKDRFLLDELHAAFDIDALTSSHPLVQEANTPDEITALFDTISYSKGASILRMINDFMGEENFVLGLTHYLNDLSYSSATHLDLFQHWEDQAAEANLQFPVRLSEILKTWTLQMGYPVVNVEKSLALNRYTITQQYFLLDPSATAVEPDNDLLYKYKWYIPFSYKSYSQIGTEDSTRIWLPPIQGTQVTVEEEYYLLANIDAMGYYRVNYDKGTWSKLTTKLKSKSFQDILSKNRAQLLDDAFNLVRAERLDLTTAMELSMYLSNEQEYVPWNSFLASAKYMEYLLSRSSLYGMFKTYLLKLVEPTLYDYYGWDEENKNDDALFERMTRQTGIKAACYYGSHNCINNATALYRMWMDDPTNKSIISNTYRRDVFCAAIRDGGEKEWQFSWEQHHVSTNAQEQDDLRYGMACSKESWILSKYTKYCVDPNLIRGQDSIRSCLGYIAEEEYGRDVVWSFMVESWDDLVDSYGGGIVFKTLIESVTKRFSTEYDLNLLINFKQSNSNLGTAARAVDQAIEKTTTNIRWRKRNEPELKSWLSMQNI